MLLNDCANKHVTSLGHLTYCFILFQVVVTSVNNYYVTSQLFNS